MQQDKLRVSGIPIALAKPWRAQKPYWQKLKQEYMLGRAKESAGYKKAQV
jgi:hypothetical protein